MLWIYSSSTLYFNAIDTKGRQVNKTFSQTGTVKDWVSNKNDGDGGDDDDDKKMLSKLKKKNEIASHKPKTDTHCNTHRVLYCKI